MIVEVVGVSEVAARKVDILVKSTFGVNKVDSWCLDHFFIAPHDSVTCQYPGQCLVSQWLSARCHVRVRDGYFLVSDFSLVP
ncbi:MAG: hypothetical protein JKY23_04080 [Nitrospinaceae bacterium]|nr:hypothetical protein [Nitrospinaceae bacterium]